MNETVEPLYLYFMYTYIEINGQFSKILNFIVAMYLLIKMNLTKLLFKHQIELNR